MSGALVLTAAGLIVATCGYIMVRGVAWWWKLPRPARVGLALLPVALLIGAGAAQGESCRPDTFYLVGAIEPDVVPHLKTWLAATKEPLLLIDSPGGVMSSSSEIHDAIKAHGNVRCRVLKVAASGAFAVLQACAAREAAANARLATHEPRAGWPGLLDRVAAATLLSHLESVSRVWNDLCRRRLKMTEAEYESRVKGRDWVMDANEALSVGAIDRVL